VQRKIFIAFFCLLIPLKVGAVAENTAALRSGILETSAQLSLEFDDNVFKTFTQEKDDGLTRVLLRSELRQNLAKGGLHFDLQAGGKAYFLHPEQDAFIGSWESEFVFHPKPEVTIGLDNEVKGQVESAATDSLDIDINETFVLDRLHGFVAHPFILQTQQTLFGEFQYFEFFGELNIDSFEGAIGDRIERNLSRTTVAQVGYRLGVTKFPNLSGRNDLTNELSLGLRYTGNWLGSLGYAFEDNSSSISAFDSTAHRINLMLSYALEQKGLFSSATLQLIANLLIRHYPSVFIADAEGQRQLFSEAENNNFNTLVMKISKRLSPHFSLEAKYSRFSNDFSDQETGFRRDLISLGLRGNF